MGGGVDIICLLPAALLMTSADRNDLMPAQEKLEWVTSKISLMTDIASTQGAKIPNIYETGLIPPDGLTGQPPGSS